MPITRPQQFWEDLVDAIHGLYGSHPGFRAVHAKGIHVKGHFVAAPAATRLSRARHYVLAGPGDALADPTVPWLADRPSMVAGRIAFTEAPDTPTGAADTSSFDLTNMTDGIACSEDEILHARSAAYCGSYTRRTR